MTGLISLPEAVLIEVLSFWSWTEEIVRLDTAFCNHKSRKLILHLFHSVIPYANNLTYCCGFAFNNSIEKYALYLNWLSLRKISVSSILLEEEQLNIPFNAGRLRELDIRGRNTCKINSSLFVNASNFVCLRMKRISISKVLDAVTTYSSVSQLKELSIHDCADFDGGTLSRLSAVCTSLCRITLSFPYPNDMNLESCLLTFAQQNQTLRKVDILGLTQHTASFISAFSSHCRHLLSFTLGSCQSTLASAAQCIMNCPQLNCLLLEDDISRFHYATDSATGDKELLLSTYNPECSGTEDLMAFFSNVTGFTYIGINYTMHISDRVLQCIADSNPLLQQLSINGCTAAFTEELYDQICENCERRNRVC